MLYDRLLRDLGQAEEALRAGSRETASSRLLSAQAIVIELRSALDTTAWDGAPGLASVYGFLLTELVGANIRGDANRTADCRRLVEPLREAWHAAIGSEAGAGRGSA